MRTLLKIAIGACVLGVCLYATSPYHEEQVRAENELKLKEELAKRRAAGRPSILAVYVESKKYVLERLKSPGSAKFSEDLNDVRQLNDSTYLVSSWVDSQNGFGALLRTKYRCEMVYSEASGLYCAKLDIF